MQNLREWWTGIPADIKDSGDAAVTLLCGRYCSVWEARLSSDHSTLIVQTRVAPNALRRWFIWLLTGIRYRRIEPWIDPRKRKTDAAN